jgi:O-antigen biosynthesis protein WbqP
VKRTFDLLLATIALPILVVPMVLIAVLIRATSRGSALYWSDRVGRYNRIFRMPKFRTMCVDTPQVPTHLMKNSGAYLTLFGSFLRRTSLDELPQIFSIFKGDLSFVGPRPALFNQDDLVALRTERGIHQLVPGLTGWAQINGRDELSIPVKVGFDYEYLQRRSFRFDLKIIALTAWKALRGDGVSR